MYKAFSAGYEYGPYQGDSIYILAQNYSDARNLLINYLVEEHLWDRVGESNISINEIGLIPPKSNVIF